MNSHTDVGPQNIDEYINMQPAEFQPALHELRALVKSLAPQAEELISYQVPCFKYHYMLVGIGVNKKFVSFYPMSSDLTRKMKDDLKGIKISGTTLHFLPGEPLPLPVIKKLILERIKENEAKAMLKQKK